MLFIRSWRLQTNREEFSPCHECKIRSEKSHLLAAHHHHGKKMRESTSQEVLMFNRHYTQSCMLITCWENVSKSEDERHLRRLFKPTAHLTLSQECISFWSSSSSLPLTHQDESGFIAYFIPLVTYISTWGSGRQVINWGAQKEKVISDSILHNIQETGVSQEKSIKEWRSLFCNLFIAEKDRHEWSWIFLTSLFLQESSLLLPLELLIDLTSER